VSRDIQRPTSCRLTEIGELDLDRHGVAESLRLLAPGPNVVRHRLHTSLNGNWIGEILGKGRFRTGGLSRTIGYDWSIILASSDRIVPRPRFAEMKLQEGD